MILGVLLITRPPAIFGQDEASQCNGNSNETSTFQNNTLDDNFTSNYYLSGIISMDQRNETLYEEEHQNVDRPYNSPIPLSGTFHQTYQEHLNNDEKDSEPDFTPAQKIVGYIACVAVPFLSALISLITRQCNNKKVPIYVLMLWFGIGASCVIIAGMLFLNLINFRNFRVFL